MGNTKYTGCGKLTTFFLWQLPYEKGSELAAPCIFLVSQITVLPKLVPRQRT
jgi:hypothetical protein